MNTYKDALPRLINGIEAAAVLVRPTLGPKGTNVVIEADLPPYAITTNDGATIIKAVEVSDPIEKVGLSFAKEVATRSDGNSGDGSSTTITLLSAILQEGQKAIASQVSPLELKNSLDECLSLVEKSLDEQTRQITVEEVPAVAKIAGENEPIANVLGEIYKTIGKDGIIHLEGSGTYDTSYKTISGVRFTGTGYLSPYMVHDEEAEKNGQKSTKAIYHNPLILVTKNRIGHQRDIDPLLTKLDQMGKKDLVIFTDDMDSGVARILIESHKMKVINCLIIKAPVLFKNYVFEDFAKCVGATIVEDASGKTFKNLSLDDLGTCEKLTCDKDEVTLIGIKDLQEHVKEIQESEYLPQQDKEVRLSYLTTKTAILKLGAKSETELSYLRLKTEDAIHSSRLALRHGVVPGGGVALKIASDTLQDTIGGRVLKIALKAPITQNCLNMGIDIPERFGDEVVDAAHVVKGAFRNALGVASTVLTISGAIVKPQKTPEQIAHDMLTSKGMRPFG